MSKLLRRTFPELPPTMMGALVDFLATSHNPFSLVHNPSFVNLLEVARSEKDIPRVLGSRQSISSVFLPKSYEFRKDRVKEALFKASDVSLTMDGWTGPRGISYTVVTCHYLDEGVCSQVCSHRLLYCGWPTQQRESH